MGGGKTTPPCVKVFGVKKICRPKACKNYTRTKISLTISLSVFFRSMVQNWFKSTLWRTIDVIDKDACWNYKVENKWRLFFIGCLFELEIFTDKRYDNAEHLTTFLKKLNHVASSDVTWRHMTLIFHKGLYILLTCAKCRQIHPMSYYLSESIWTDNSNEGSYMPVRVLVVP